AGRVACFGADFRQPGEPAALARQAAEFLGGVDVLVNNAGITMNRPFDSVTAEQFDTLYQVNVRAMFFVTQALVPGMITRGGGVVINLTSVHALEGMPEHTVYAGTKGAIVAFTRSLAIELAPKGIRVNAIAPGAIEVENYRVAMPDYDADALGRTIPCGFVGMPADVAKVAVFLAGDDARYIVGQTLVVDGGTTSWMPFHDGFRRPLGGRFGQGYVD
ncbi:MAG: SDR family oxidoreductase, partial [Pirellulales bacterium]|nr:SDR family oxidoreductase [Pirellulales bacterium]